MGHKKTVKLGNNTLAISFIPYSELASMESMTKIKKILDWCLDNRILIIQGSLTPTEEASLIQSTMALVGRVKGFKGIEIATINGNKKEETLMERMKENLAKALVGDRAIITLIGPAAIVKDIKKDPKKIELLLK
ncbi:MAG: DUF2073 domain-containing protein [Nanoarchaeota archaeon]